MIYRLFCQVVVLVNAPLEKQLEINDWTHQNGVHFITAGTRGLFGYVITLFSPTVLNRCQVMRSMILALNLLVLIQPANSRYLE
jgi:hypothetical protein